MSETKLLPCPFCGGEAEMDCDSRFNDWFVRCTKCFCKTRTFKTERSAILIWNNRKPMERIVERLEELEVKFCYDPFRDEYRYKGIGVEDVIKIVKEEGGFCD